MASEGDDVLFLAQDLPENIVALAWFKGLKDMTKIIAIYVLQNNLTMTGPVHSGRETIYGNGSLLFEKVNLKDKGFYTLQTYNRHAKIVSISYLYLNVHASHSPFCNPLNSSQLMIQAVPPYPAEGQAVLLKVLKVPEDLQEFSWYKLKDRTTRVKLLQYRRAKKTFCWAPAQRIRGRVYKNGSVVLQDVNDNDSGMYTLEVLNKDSNIEKANVEFFVKKSLTQPFVQITDTTVTGGTSVIFTCITPDADTFIHWNFNNQTLQLSERLTLSPTRCAFRIDPVRNEDAGMYQCEVSNGFSSKTSLPEYKLKSYFKMGAFPSSVGGRCATFQWHIIEIGLVCFLTSWHLSISTAAESWPPQVAEGESVLFLAYRVPENLQALAWFKGLSYLKEGLREIAIYGLHNNLSAPGPLHSGRETIFHNGSLLIEKLTQKDTGFYTLRTYNKQGKIVSTTPLYLEVRGSLTFLWNCGRISTSIRPTIESVPPIVTEGENVRLFVHNLPENLEGFIWFKGMNVFKDQEIGRYIVHRRSSVTGPAHSGREILNSDGSLVLQNVTEKDAGLYTLQIMRTDLKSDEAHVQLLVNSSLSPCCNPLTSSKLMIQPVPLYVAEGESILLQVYNLPEDLQTYTWYRATYTERHFEIVEYSRDMNTVTWGDQYSRRETLFANGSLLLENVMEKDAGMHMLVILHSDFRIEKAYVNFHVNRFGEKSVVSREALLKIVAQPFIENHRMLGTNLQAYFKRMQKQNVVFLNSTGLNRTTVKTIVVLVGIRQLKGASAHSHKAEASFLICWYLSTTAEITIESVPLQVVEGENVLLHVGNLPENVLSFSWFKGLRNTGLGIVLHFVKSNLTVIGPEYSYRETVYSNGSLQLKNVNQKDTGFYTLRIINQDTKIASAATIYLHVYTSLFTCGRPPPSSKPYIELVPPNVAEGKNVLLLAHNLPENIHTIFWYKGVIAYKKFEIARHIRSIDSSVQGPAHSAREALFGNGSLLFYNVMGKDTGFYTLRVFTTDLKVQETHVQLQVNTCQGSLCSDSLTSPQVTIKSVPPYVVEGESVLFQVYTLTEDHQEIFWYKSVFSSDIFKIAEYSRSTSSIIYGLAHSQRETMYNNGSLLIQNITEKDAGMYMLETLNRNYKFENTYVQLHVNKPWKEALWRRPLVTSILTCWLTPIVSKITIDSVPAISAEGDNVFLFVRNMPENIQAFSWYKGVMVLKSREVAKYVRANNSSMLGPAYTGREKIFNQGSLLIKNVTRKDSGYYILQTLDTNLTSKIIRTEFFVHTPIFGKKKNTKKHAAPFQLKIELVPPIIAEEDNVLLLAHNLPEKLQGFAWHKGVLPLDHLKIASHSVLINSSFLGHSYYDRATIYANGSLLLQNVTEKDIGIYTLRTISSDLRSEWQVLGFMANKTTRLLLQGFEEMVGILLKFFLCSVFPCSASILTCWLTPIVSKITIDSVPPISAEGDNVLLFVHNMSENIQAFSWYKGVMVLKSREVAKCVRANYSCVLGPAYSGREKIFNQGSLLIKNVTRKDSGYYILQTLDTNLKSKIIRAEFFVHTPIIGKKKNTKKPATPSQLKIELVPPIIAEEDNVLLLAHNLPEKLQGFAWHKGVLPLDHLKIASHSVLINSSFLGHSYYDRATIYTNGSLLLQNVTKKDIGIYTLRTISADLRSEWAIIHLQINNKNFSMTPE
ncbi:carcinoembryonic antigen-related cell adhesion molecule 3-like [Sigmodon hispidus]